MAGGCRTWLVKTDVYGPWLQGHVLFHAGPAMWPSDCILVWIMFVVEATLPVLQQLVTAGHALPRSSNKMEDLERFRQPWEPNEHWAMRREFIRRHWNRFSENRLLCLAQTFVNMELLGCAYPARVAELVRELAKDVPRSERAKAPAVAPVAFVKASEPSSEEASASPATKSYTPVPDRPQFVGGFANRAGLGCKPASSDDSVVPNSAVPTRQQFVGGFANRAGTWVRAAQAVGRRWRSSRLCECREG
ncbi:hypothetical protein MTO96_000569 [Rhipicephalus appendiculatus]